MNIINSKKITHLYSPETISYNLKEIGKEAAEKAEKEHIRNTLSYTNWNRKAAARLLQISYKALLYKIEKYDLNGYQKSIDKAQDGNKR